MSTVEEIVVPPARFHHEAVFYADDDEYLAGIVPFIDEGLEGGESVLVAVPVAKLDLLRGALGAAGGADLSFVSMEEMGRNPARIIPAWADFVAAHSDATRPARGVGEPIWHGRSADELAECGRHEALINLAFAHHPGFQLLCPYDTESLDTDTIDEARQNHPHLSRRGAVAPSDSFVADVPALMGSTLPPVPSNAPRFEFDAEQLGMVRRRTAQVAAEAGVDDTRIGDLLLAVSEAGSNSVRHGGGSGEVSWWTDGTSFVCEVRDKGRISDPLAGRRRPTADRPDGRGLWLMNQLCDLVQIRALPDGQLVRLHIRA